MLNSEHRFEKLSGNFKTYYSTETLRQVNQAECLRLQRFFAKDSNRFKDKIASYSVKI
jgi:hypothetical protein